MNKLYFVTIIFMFPSYASAAWYFSKSTVNETKISECTQASDDYMVFSNWARSSFGSGNVGCSDSKAMSEKFGNKATLPYHIMCLNRSTFESAGWYYFRDKNKCIDFRNEELSKSK